MSDVREVAALLRREELRQRMASAWREGFIAGLELNVMPNPYLEGKQ